MFSSGAPLADKNFTGESMNTYLATSHWTSLGKVWTHSSLLPTELHWWKYESMNAYFPTSHWTSLVKVWKYESILPYFPLNFTGESMKVWTHTSLLPTKFSRAIICRIRSGKTRHIFKCYQMSENTIWYIRLNSLASINFQSSEICHTRCV